MLQIVKLLSYPYQKSENPKKPKHLNTRISPNVYTTRYTRWQIYLTKQFYAINAEEKWTI